MQSICQHWAVAWFWRMMCVVDLKRRYQKWHLITANRTSSNNDTFDNRECPFAQRMWFNLRQTLLFHKNLRWKSIKRNLIEMVLNEFLSSSKQQQQKAMTNIPPNQQQTKNPKFAKHSSILWHGKRRWITCWLIHVSAKFYLSGSLCVVANGHRFIALKTDNHMESLNLSIENAKMLSSPCT